jgi:class 3 adenylate cyclase/tetratricopeptide (TPR) repeat protein
MKCPRCQHDNLPAQRFCGECDARLGSTCPSCGHANPPEQKFCGECGTALANTAVTQPEKYIPKHLAERILNSRSAIEGERKQVTVLFADVKGSMELLADRDPEEARIILDPVLERMMDAVHRYEGTVNQVMGDGIMALFGAPLALEAHAVRACYAALAMRSAIKAYSEQLRSSQDVEVQIRVGLNSGEVVVRVVGSDLRMDYSAVGQTTHMAARMEQMATPGTIQLTLSTLRAAQELIQVASLGAVPVKGIAEPLEIFELVGAGAARSRLQAAAARGLTSFVGRTDELDQLNRALERARAGHGEVVALVGEPGVGKSRLVWEFVHSPLTRSCLVLESESVSYGKAAPYEPIVSLLRAYVGIEDRDEAYRVREKLTRKIRTLDPQLELLLSPLLALLDVTLEDVEWGRLDPPQRRQRILGACNRVLLREAQVQPLVVVFEDLHGIDSETQAFLDSLVDSVPTARLLLFVSYRPEYQNRWTTKTYCRQLCIDPLSGESAEALLRAMLGDDSSLLPLKHLLMERTGGNPLFLEESVRTLVETTELQGSRGAHRLTSPATSIRVPATVQPLLAARIDRLAPEDKRLLEAAAVIGKDVPYTVLEAIAELPEAELRQGLVDLQATEFLYESSLFPDPEYTFKHALTHEVAYASILQKRRRTLHARIVDVIERLYPDRLVEHIERLGHHAFRGEVWEKAARYLRQAGGKAFDRSANRQAVECFEQALDALKHLSEGRRIHEQAIDLRFELRNALLPLGDFGRLYDYLREAETLAHALGDQPRLGQASAYLAHYYLLTGHYHQAIESGERGLVIAQNVGDASVQVGSTYYVGLAYYYLGNYLRAVEFQKRVVTLVDGQMATARFGMAGLPAVFCRAVLALALGELGQFADGIAFGEEALHISETAKHPYSLIWALVAGGDLYLQKGDLNAAVRLLEQGMKLCEEVHLTFWFPFVASGLGSAYALSGRILQAVPLLERAVQAAKTLKLVSLRSSMVMWLSEAYLIAGRTNEAAQVAGEALDLARAQKEQGWEAWALRQIGEIYSQRRPSEVEKAEQSYRQAIALAEELGMRPLVAHCWLGLGELAQKSGWRSRGTEQLATAATMFRDMDMQFWLNKAETALANA